MSSAPRQSITNEAAIRPHENAFQRWSAPDPSELVQQPFPPTERHSTMDTHMPPSFRVYQPAEMRSAPMRRGSYHSIELGGAESDTVGARTLLKWTGIGILAGLCVLTGLILVLNLSDDTKRGAASTNARATLGKLPEAAAAPPPPPVVVRAPAAPVLEIDAPAPVAPSRPAPPPKKAVAAKKSSTKRR